MKGIDSAKAQDRGYFRILFNSHPILLASAFLFASIAAIVIDLMNTPVTLSNASSMLVTIIPGILLRSNIKKLPIQWSVPIVLSTILIKSITLMSIFVIYFSIAFSIMPDANNLHVTIAFFISGFFVGFFSYTRRNQDSVYISDKVIDEIDGENEWKVEFRKKYPFYGRILIREGGIDLDKDALYQYALHEAGHAVTLGLLPEKIRGAAEIYLTDSANSFVNRLDVDGHEHAQSNMIQRFNNLYVLGGYVCTNESTGYEVPGAGVDFMEWQVRVKSQLVNELDTRYIVAPQTQSEVDHNINLLESIKKEQIEALQEFYHANADIYSEIVDYIFVNRFMDCKTLNSILNRAEKTPKASAIIHYEESRLP